MMNAEFKNKTLPYRGFILHSAFIIHHWLLSPIFLLHWSKLHGGRIERNNLQIDAAIGADDDLANFGVLGQGNFGSAFGTGNGRHDLFSLLVSPSPILGEGGGEGNFGVVNLFFDGIGGGSPRGISPFD
jgi:hypothetical protein